MADFRLAAQTAFYAVLAADAALNAAIRAAMHEVGDVPQGDRVFGHVPEQMQPPMAVIADVSSTPIGGKGGGLDQVTVSLFYAARQPSREFLSPLMAAGRSALEERALSVTLGVRLSAPVWAGEEDDLMDDGETYAGVQRFTLFAQSA